MGSILSSVKRKLGVAKTKIARSDHKAKKGLEILKRDEKQATALESYNNEIDDLLENFEKNLKEYKEKEKLRDTNSRWLISNMTTYEKLYYKESKIILEHCKKNFEEIKSKIAKKLSDIFADKHSSIKLAFKYIAIRKDNKIIDEIKNSK